MNVDEPDSLAEDQFTSLVAACDEALAAGVETPIPPEVAPTEQRARLERDLAQVRLLRHYLRRPSSPASDQETAEDPSSDHPALRLPCSQLGRFQIRRELGRGGFGMVFQAYDPLLGREVALKVPRADVLVTPDLRARFHREAKAAAGLDHPNLVPVYEAGEIGPICYIASAYCPGITLAAWLRQLNEPFPFRTASEIMVKLALAVQHAHERGVVHRDLKPANILLQRKSQIPDPKSEKEHSRVASDLEFGIWNLEPKVTDFGLAKFSSSEASTGQTQSGAILGTPSYMAPEQAGGQTKDLGPVTDVYALGAILYELLTGRPPFRSDTVLDTLQQVQNDEPVRVARLRPKVPRDLETICLKCLEKRPEKRYASAAALADDLRRFLAGETIAAQPVGPLGRLSRWSRRKPLIAVLSLAVAGLLLLVTVGSPLAVLLLSQERNQAQRNQHRAEQAEQEAIDQLWQAYLDRALAGVWSRKAGQRFDGLDVLARAAQIRPGLAVRNAAIACLARTDLKLLKQWDRPPTADYSWTFDSQLERYAYKDTDSNISVRRISDKVEIRSLPGPGCFAWAYGLRFSPDGRFFGAVYNYSNNEQPQCFIWDLADGKVLWKVSASGRSLDFSPDSRRTAVGGTDNSIGVFESASGNELYRLRPSSRQHRIAFQPDGRRLAVSSAEDRLVEIRDLETGKVEAQFVHPAGVDFSAWSRDGRLLATGCIDRNAYVWDVPAGRQLSVLQHMDAVRDVTFNHAGDVLATNSWDGRTRLWDPISGNLLVSAVGFCQHFSADDRYLAFAIGLQMGIWEVGGGREWRTLHHGRIGNRTPWSDWTGPWGVDFSPDGQLLASAGNDGVRLWNPVTAQEVAHLPVGRAWAALFHPDGNCLASFGQAGPYRWPIRSVPGVPSGGLRLGPPQCVDPTLKTEVYQAAWDHDGRTLAFLVLQGHQIVVLPFQNPGQKVQLQGSVRDTWLDLSPDGRWVAVAALMSAVKVWDLTGGESVRQLPPSRRWENSRFLAFSPDGRWLVTREDDRYRCWRVGSWELALEIARPDKEWSPGPLAFSRDGLLAVVWPYHSVLLLNPATGEEIASLSSPDPQTPHKLCFSPDGSQLAVATDNHTIQLWDLRLIRRQLAEMNLDWNWPPFPQPSKAAAPPEPVEVLLGEFAREPSSGPVPPSAVLPSQATKP